MLSDAVGDVERSRRGQVIDMTRLTEATTKSCMARDR